MINKYKEHIKLTFLHQYISLLLLICPKVRMYINSTNDISVIVKFLLNLNVNTFYTDLIIKYYRSIKRNNF